MRGIICTDLSGPEAVEARDDLPEPEAAPGMVLIDVKAAGVAFPDLLLTRGQYQMKADPPFTPGAEVCGTVIEGEGFEPGTRVTAMTGFVGAWAEKAVAPAITTFAIPDRLSDEQAAGFVMNYHTAWFALARRARLEAGEVVLVHGAGGGLGTATVQVAKAMNAHVIGVAKGDEKQEAAKQAGADEVVDPDGPWLEVAKQHGGVNVLADIVGGDRIIDSLRALTTEGRLLILGFTGGSIPQIPANRLLLKNVDVRGVGWGGYVFAGNTDLLQTAQQELNAMIEAGTVSPVVNRTYPLDHARQALEDMDERRAVGKLVLTVAA